MTLHVRIREEAEIEPSDAAIWYEEQRPGLGMGSWIKFYRSYIHFLTILFSMLSITRKCVGRCLVDGSCV